MKAVLQLWLLPCRQMPLLASLAQLLWLAAAAAVALAPVQEGAALGGVLLAIGSWFWHMGLGLALRGACQAESFLLPDLRRRLAGLAVADATQWILFPALLALALGPPCVGLVTAGLTLAAAMGFAMGVERWISLLFWPLLILAGWMPGFTAAMLEGAPRSPLTIPLLLLVAALLLRLVLRPMLTIGDGAPTGSPLAEPQLGSGPESPARHSALGRRVEEWFDTLGQRALEQALGRYRTRPDAAHRIALVRRLLLPHDNLAALALRLALMAAFAALYLIVVLHRQHFDATMVGACAVVVALARFPQVGRGMLRMRPHLADLYLTLAPRTRADFQRTLAEALLVLVPVGTLSALAYTALGILITRAERPGLMLLTTLIVACAGALVALAVHLIGPQNAVGRQVVNLLVLLGATASYWGGVWLVDTLGYLIGGGLLATIALGFGLGVWSGAQREYLRRTPCFDAPLA